MTHHSSNNTTHGSYTTGADDIDDFGAFTANLGKIAERAELLVQEYTKHLGQDDMSLAGQVSVAQSFGQMLTQMTLNPEPYLEAGMEWYQNYLTLLGEATNSFWSGEDVSFSQKHAPDRRFANEAWTENVIFDFLKQSYLLTSDWMHKTVEESAETLDQKTARKLRFYTKQAADAMSPGNFLITNPEVIHETLSTNGENLVKGLENLLHDLQENKGKLRVSLTDTSAFTVGKDLATTKGAVIFENELLQLIQYAPTTTKVHTTPLLIISPWINKYYILDMHEHNSLVKWLTDQGYTVFITSWVNPTPEMADTSFDDYLLKGALQAVDVVRTITEQSSINVTGYCLGGTLLASLLAYLSKKGEQDKIKSATFFTTLVDFSDPGDLETFIDEGQLDEMEGRLQEAGVLSGAEMGIIFSALRSRELVWSGVIHNYLMGKTPFAFDLLYWNSDSTALPRNMLLFYLRNMYLHNRLIEPNALTIGGEKIDLGTINTPCYFLSAKEDHIAPWQTTYKATHIFNGPCTFVLSGSGHIAGVVNPPAKNKYGYCSNDDIVDDPEQWLENATQHKGSWWTHWDKWLCQNKRNGNKTDARQPGCKTHPVIENAPGSYVLKRG